MTEVNIFESAKEKEMPSWASFKNPGDNIQGTYVGCIKGQIDGYGNEQIIYQLLGTDGKVTNVGFGLNKKFIISEMEQVKFGEIVGFKFKAWVTVKNKMGKETNVKDYAIYHDPKIVDATWIKENAGNMPSVTVSSGDEDKKKIEKEFENYGKKPVDDVPFSSEGSITNEDKLAVINKLASDKLGVTDPAQVKDIVMEKTALAFIVGNYDKIIVALNEIA